MFMGLKKNIVICGIFGFMLFTMVSMGVDYTHLQQKYVEKVQHEKWALEMLKQPLEKREEIRHAVESKIFI